MLWKNIQYIKKEIWIQPVGVYKRFHFWYHSLEISDFSLWFETINFGLTERAWNDIFEPYGD